jgi:pilus assembly protein CpaF
MFVILISEKGGSKQRQEFDEEVISIGRVQGNQVILPRGNVSKRHAKIELKNGQFLLSDFGSTNGTYVNGRRLKEPVRIYSDDKVYIGEYILSLEGHDALEREDGASNTVDENDDLPPMDGISISPPPKVIDDEDSLPELVSPPRISRPQAPAPPPRSRVTAVSLDKKKEKAEEPPVEQPSAVELPQPPSLSADEPIEPTPLEEQDTADVEEPSVEDSATEKVSSVEDSSTDEVYTVVEALLDKVARQVKRIDRTNVPSKVDGGVAGTVRIVVDDLVKDMISSGKLPTAVEPARLKGKVFRAAIDIGPLNAWLEDIEVERIRITRSDTIFLFKKGKWVESERGFVSSNDLAEALHCLSAGIEVREVTADGISRYRLEEGYSVFSASGSGSICGPAVIIDKTTAFGETGSDDGIFQSAALKVIREALDGRVKLAVIGGSGTERLAAIGELIEMLPEEDFVVSIEDLACAHEINKRGLRLTFSGNSQGKETGKMQSLLFHAAATDPRWLVASGVGWLDVPYVLAAAAQRLGVIADLPLGAVGHIDRELVVALGTSGVSLRPDQAAVLLEESFDIIAVVGRDTTGAIVVERVLACALSEKGGWAPQILFDRGRKS